MSAVAARLRFSAGLRGLHAAAAAIRLGWESGWFWWTLPLILSTVAGVVPAAGAIFTRQLVDLLTKQNADGRHIAALALAIAASTAAAQVLTLSASYASNVAKQRLTILSGRRLLERVAGFSGLRYFEEPAFHDRLVLAEQAAQTTPSLVTTTLQQMLQALVVIISFFGTLLVVWPAMALLLGLAVVPALIMQLLRARQMADTTRAFTATQRRAALYWRWFFDPKSAKEMRVFGFGPLFADRYAAGLTERARALLAVDRRSAIVQSALALLNGGIATIGLAVVATRVNHGRLHIGDMVLFIAALSAIQGALGGIVLRTADVAAALRLFPNYLDIVGARDDISSGTASPGPLRGEIVLRDVWFRYREDAPWVLKGLNLSIPAGRTLGLVGLNGAGKTTMVKLLLRFYDPDRGSITWDGIDIRTFVPEALRDHVSAAFQDFENYDLTAAENIGLGSPLHLEDRARIERAAERAGVADTISRLPHGYDTLLSLSFGDTSGSRGMTMSGGQWQRVALARAMMRPEADLVVLDEPTAGLDPEAEHEIRALMRSLGWRRTTVMVSHRLAALKDADRIVVLSDGEIAESGTHDELMARDGQYARLFNLQAGPETTRSFTGTALVAGEPC